MKKRKPKEKKLDKIHYSVIVLFIILNVLHHLFLDRRTIGENGMYSTYILLYPILFGLFVLGIYRRAYILKIITGKDTVFEKSFHLFFVVFQGILFSYIIFGFLARSVWNQYNLIETQKSPTEYIICDIERFSFPKGAKNPSIYFSFNKETEYITSNYQSIKEYEGKDPKKYKLALQVREGLWDTYIIKTYDIKKSN